MEPKLKSCVRTQCAQNKTPCSQRDNCSIEDMIVFPCPTFQHTFCCHSLTSGEIDCHPPEKTRCGQLVIFIVLCPSSKSLEGKWSLIGLYCAQREATPPSIRDSFARFKGTSFKNANRKLCIMYTRPQKTHLCTYEGNLTTQSME